MDVIEACAASIGGVGDMHPAAGQTPDEKAVDCAETQLAGRGAVARAIHTVKNPGKFGGGEIGVGHSFLWSPSLHGRHSSPRQMSAVRRSCQTMAL